MKNDSQFEIFVMMSEFLKQYINEQHENQKNGIEDNWIKLSIAESIMLPVAEEYIAEHGEEKEAISKISWREGKADKYRVGPMTALLGMLDVGMVSNHVVETLGQKSITYDENIDSFFLDLALFSEALDAYEQALDLAGEGSLYLDEVEMDKSEGQNSVNQKRLANENKKREMN